MIANLILLIIDLIGWVIVWIITLGGYRVDLKIEVEGAEKVITILPRLW